MLLLRSRDNRTKQWRPEADPESKQPVTPGRLPNDPVSGVGRRPIFSIGTNVMTTKARISAGVCGLETNVTVRSQGARCEIAIKSNCKFVQELAEELTEVEPLGEILSQDQVPRICHLAAKHRLHAACPVPTGILKAIEVESGLALPAEVSIVLSRE
jgi:hypothetical protein